MSAVEATVRPADHTARTGVAKPRAAAHSSRRQRERRGEVKLAPFVSQRLPRARAHDAGQESMRIEVICTGDEVLTGKIVNTNFSYISQKLEDFGLSVKWETTVGDDRDSLLLAFELAGARADAVIVNGGLGPTVDDLSQEIAARAAGVELVLSEEWLVKMESYFHRRNRPMAPNNRKQAMLPRGAEVLDNPVGTACGFAL